MNPVLQPVTGDLCCILFGLTLTAVKHKYILINTDF